MTHRKLLPAVLLLFVWIWAQCTSSEKHDYYSFEWQDEDGYRWAELPVKSGHTVGFHSVSSVWSGVDFVNGLTPDQIADNRNLLNGSGVAAGDLTGNGFPDLLFLRLDGPNVLYENLGAFRFQDITEGSGLALPDQFSTGALVADFNGNGLNDVVITAIGSPNRLFFNQGGGVFEEAPGGLPASRTYGSMTAAAGDLTGNGAPDIYITNFKERSVRDSHWGRNTMRHIVETLDDGSFRVTEEFEGHYKLSLRGNTLVWFELGEPDLLYLNDGAGNFTKMPLTSGMFLDEDGNPVTEIMPDWGLDVGIQDLTGNGLPDIFVANDFESPDRIWINQGDGTFRALPPLAIRKSSLSAMAVAFSDLQRNGLTDMFVVEMLSRSHEERQRQMSTLAPSQQEPGLYTDRPQFLGNTLYLNRGDNTWAEIAEYAGVHRSEWSWGTVFLDVNLNGFEDILITNGHYFDVQDTDANTMIGAKLQRRMISGERYMLEYPRLPNRNAAFRNNGDLTFTDTGEAWGFASLDISHGMALADLNKDGYPDVIINRVDEPALILKNRATQPRIAVRLRGTSPNTTAIGAVIEVEGGPVPQSKYVRGGGTYLSTSEYSYTFAAGEAERLRIRVRWPDGSERVLDDVRPNRIYEINQRAAAVVPAAPQPEAEPVQPLFRDATSALAHRHTQQRYNDFERQPLLPYHLSQHGPLTAVIENPASAGGTRIFVTSGPGETLSGFSARRGGGWRQDAITLAPDFEAYEKSAVSGWYDAEGRLHLLVAYSNYQTGAGSAPAAVYYQLTGNRAETVQVLEGFGATIGGIFLADYSGNGYPDLLLTGRVEPGRYPEAADSRLYLNEGGRFVPDARNNALLESIGLVQGAVFSDLTGNGRPELLLAPRWGALRVLGLDAQRQFTDITAELGLDSGSGWWNGITTGDLTGNGRPDIVATNWGLNHLYASAQGGEALIFYEDFAGMGTNSVIESYRDEAGRYLPRRNFEMLSRNPPFIRNTARTFSNYAQMSLPLILGRPIDALNRVEASQFAHMLFLQDDAGRFHARALPPEAQFAPAFEVIIADFTGDGNEDVFLSQNFFAYIPETPRSDAGRGLLLQGDGRGNLNPVPGQLSGILVYGEQRGASAADLTGDGRLDLLVAQNGAETRLLLNQAAEPGLRVLLAGSPENPAAIGARLFLKYEDGSTGPQREVRAASGFGSQHGFVQVMGIRPGGSPVSVQVIWPDQTQTEHPLQPGQREIRLQHGITP
ncbi:MAG: VCBS repeat-containing protein [Balneolales bacterium]|nr:VCBS repeat-containing protein [Balneolales bacterium]